MEINKQKLKDWLIEQESKELKRGNIHAASGYNHTVHELLSGTFDSPSTQEGEGYEIAEALSKQASVLQDAIEYTVSESLAYEGRAIQAEKERDVAVKALEWIADNSAATFIEEKCRTTLSEIRRNTDEATS